MGLYHIGLTNRIDSLLSIRARKNAFSLTMTVHVVLLMVRLPPILVPRIIEPIQIYSAH